MAIREIIFRGKTIYEDCFIYGGYSKNCETGKTYIVCMGEDHISAIAYHKEVIPETVGQFTGLTDKNGKKIFEGDILRGYSYPYQDFEGNFNYYAEVVWFDDVPAFGLIKHSYPEAYRRLSEGDSDYFKDFESEDWKIICKIHEIIELLKGEEE